MGTLINSADLDEMQYNAAFHQGLHCLLRLKQSSGQVQNEQSHTYCSNMYGKIYKNTELSRTLLNVDFFPRPYADGI